MVSRQNWGVVAPVHLFVHMRGTYRIGVFGTLARMVVLFAGSLIAYALLMAGLVLVDGDALINTPLLDEKGIFRVAVMSRKVETLNCPIVYPDMTGMIDMALDLLVARGRRRVATLISVPQQQEVGRL